ncbi:MAG TPA: outer membrane beta-barrel protein [Candidatus Acidoferrales bacterium]|nr:outer membrane beta-barrel protein [Candidatus Acidoferrales bacterium]
MKFDKWTVALVTLGGVTLGSAARADEKMSAVQTALSNSVLSGYVDTAATWRPGTDTTPFGGVNMPFGTAKNDGFSLNAVDIALDRPQDESPWAAGYHAEFMLGPDAVTTGGFGVNGIRQAYVMVRTPLGNGIDWKIGAWDTIVGYESNSDPLNPNYTRSYAWTIDPKLHTGILATYPFTGWLTVQAGIADSSDTGFGTVGVNPASFESQKAYMGDVEFTAPDSAGLLKGATFKVAVIDVAGNHTTLTPGTTSFYAGATTPTPLSALTMGAAFDYLDEHNGGYGGNPSNDSLWTVALYSSYQATDRLSIHLRAEYLNNMSAGPLSPLTLYPNNKAEEITLTGQFNWWANVLTRVEFRWDHVEHGDAFGSDPTTGAPNRGNDYMLALNVIYQF